MQSDAQEQIKMKSNTPAIEDELAPAQMIAARFSSPKRGARAYCCSLAPKAFAAAPETGARDALVGPRPTATDEACPGSLVGARSCPMRIHWL